MEKSMPGDKTGQGQPPSIEQVLRELDIGLADKPLVALARKLNRQDLAVGEYLMHQGVPGESFHLVVSGTLEVVSHGMAGREVIYRTLERGESIGELTVADGALRTASVRAATESELLSVSRRQFLDVAHRQPQLGLWLAAVCAEKARRLAIWSDGRSLSEVRPRLAGLLLELSEETDDPSIRQLQSSQKALGDRLGITREWINKQLKDFEREGIVKIGRGRVEILDVPTMALIT